MNRKQFLRRAGALVGLVALPELVCSIAAAETNTPASLPESTGFHKPTYRIAGLPDHQYGSGFHRLCRYGRFDSMQSAVSSVRNPNVEFLIICE